MNIVRWVMFGVCDIFWLDKKTCVYCPNFNPFCPKIVIVSDRIFFIISKPEIISFRPPTFAPFSSILFLHFTPSTMSTNHAKYVYLYNSTTIHTLLYNVHICWCTTTLWTLQETTRVHKTVNLQNMFCIAGYKLDFED